VANAGRLPAAELVQNLQALAHQEDERGGLGDRPAHFVRAFEHHLEPLPLEVLGGEPENLGIIHLPAGGVGRLPKDAPADLVGGVAGRLARGRLGERHVFGPVHIDDGWDDGAVHGVAPIDQPGEEVPQASQPRRGGERGDPFRHQIHPRCDQFPRAPAQACDASGAVEVGPERALVRHEGRDAEHQRVRGKSPGGFDESDEVPLGAPGVDGRDQRAHRAEEARDFAKALEGGAGRLHDESEGEIGEARPHPVRAVPLLLVQDDRQRPDAGGGEVPDHALDQGRSGHGHHGLRHRPPRVAQAAARPRREDAAVPDRRPAHSKRSSSSSSE